MKLIVAKLCGFCAGVNYTIKKAKETLDNSNENIYCLGEIIHNESVIKSLEDQGMITVESLEEIPANSKVIFRAHGEAKEVYDKAASKNLEVIDLTCGKVRAIHIKVEKAAADSYIIIIGKKKHPETIGTFGYAKPNAFIVESIEDIEEAVNNINASSLNKVYVVAQTTFNDNKFDLLVNELQNKITKEIIIDKTICDATKNRQEEAKEISKKVNKMIIIGGKNSSNTKELATLALENCPNVYLVQTLEDLKDVEFQSSDIIGITAGASTPNESINEIIDHLKSIGE